ncbi:DGQHR domain-containing protein [Burkholderia gladioli]|uniref:DNA sulfur modification protein DndB n=1 Tax=Burkholderia gladioli TaxID=28095 RepID=UPI00155F95CE|nr:DGQHR domain-containing protein [Burkholderia gladioli]
MSVHNDSFKAQTKAQRLNTQGGHGVTDRAFAAISSDETLTKGECYPEVLAQYFQDKYEADAIHAMKGVLDPHWRGSPPVTTDMTGWALADLKLTLAELRTRYQDRAQAELDAARDKHAENAERAARARAVSNELVTERSEFTYTFPAVAGVQAGRAYYAAQVPYGALVKLFTFDSADAVPAHLRAQRVLNERRAEDIGDYVTENPTNYVLPAITASVSAEMWFEALSVAGAAGRVGLLHIPMDATLLINDGQHRRRGIEHAIEKQPTLRDETITVTIYFDQGLERSQQMFADINGKQVKPSSAINALYDRRDPFNAWALSVMGILPGVGTLVDVENSTVPAKSYKLWSLVSFKKFLSVLTGVNAKNIADIEPKRIAEIDTFLVSFFEQCSAHIPKWAAMIDRDISAVEVREQYVIGHAVWLEALATFARRALFTGYLMDHGRTEEGVIRPDLAVWEQMAALSKIDPRRASLMWDNRCVVLGKMQKTTDGVKATAAKLLTLANVWLPPDLATLDKRLQEQFGPAPRAA